MMLLKFWKTRDPPQKAPELPDSTTICLTFVDAKKLDELEKIVGWKFKSRALLAQAITHSSCHTIINGKVIVQSNEDLEHLGDKVIGLALAAFLHKKYPAETKHFYSQVIAKALSNATLTDIGKSLGLEAFLVTKTEDLLAKKSAGDTFEAICGALHLDGGSAAVDIFLKHYLFPRAERVIKEKGLLAEKAKA